MRGRRNFFLWPSAIEIDLCVAWCCPFLHEVAWHALPLAWSTPLLRSVAYGSATYTDVDAVGQGKMWDCKTSKMSPIPACRAQRLRLIRGGASGRARPHRCQRWLPPSCSRAQSAESSVISVFPQTQSSSHLPGHLQSSTRLGLVDRVSASGVEPPDSRVRSILITLFSAPRDASMVLRPRLFAGLLAHWPIGPIRNSELRGTNLLCRVTRGANRAFVFPVLHVYMAFGGHY
jgi:hypothetical protein